MNRMAKWMACFVVILSASVISAQSQFSFSGGRSFLRKAGNRRAV